MNKIIIDLTPAQTAALLPLLYTVRAANNGRVTSKVATIAQIVWFNSFDDDYNLSDKTNNFRLYAAVLDGNTAAAVARAISRGGTLEIVTTPPPAPALTGPTEAEVRLAEEML